MRVLIVSLLVALAAVPVAAAGNRVEPSLAPLASELAGKTVSVSCSSTLEVNGHYAAGTVDRVGGSSMLLAKDVCDALLRRVPFPDWAIGLVTIAHEAQHLKGVADESAADCTALRIAASIGIRYYGLKRKQLHSIMDRAWQQHRAKSAPYQTLC